MRKIKIFTLSLFSFFSFSHAQDIEPTGKSLLPIVSLNQDIRVKFGGFVRAEYYADSREIVGAIDDLFGFFPENKRPGADGKDLNNVFRHNFSTQTTRFSALFSGVNFLNARSSAYFEFDFSGGNSVNVRLRHAWAKLTWNKSELLLGKTWNPMADITFPNVGGLHTGVPFRPFGRGDQIRFTYNFTPRYQLLVAGLFQTEHRSVMDPSALTDIRANPAPDFHLQFRYHSPTLFAGIASEYKI
ncbi:MAG: hypothetical protein LUG18_14040 [Candidatus Azobacteroides sp.]|nr:hypothetical protein [Candidatus Azobacteroides sp.]